MPDFVQCIQWDGEQRFASEKYRCLTANFYVQTFQQQKKPNIAKKVKNEQHRRRIYEGWNFNSGNYLFTTDTK